MIKLTYEQINSPTFVEGLKVLVNEVFPMQVSYHIGRVQDKIMTEIRQANLDWKKMMETKVEWIGEGTDKKPKDMTQFLDLEKEFLAITFEIDKRPLHVMDIPKAKLTPLQMMALAPILTGLETLDMPQEMAQAEKSPLEVVQSLQ